MAQQCELLTGAKAPVPSEQERLHALLHFEREAISKGHHCVAGIDEAGRGPLAGPVAAACCYIPEGILLPGVNDSKQLRPSTRRKLYDELLNHPDIVFHISIVDHQVIDEINILQATIKAMLEAVDGMAKTPDYLLVDGLKLPHPTIPGQKIIKGDSLSMSIAAASILAKEARDLLMEEYHRQWPEYGFDRHKGYGTAAHLKALHQHGPCPIHRTTFEPVKSFKV